MSRLPGEIIHPHPPSPSSDSGGPGGAPAQSSWWSRYQESLEASLTPTARKIVEIDSRYIVDQGILAAEPLTSTMWPAGQVRRGLVMGAVQSGKTASMIAVLSMSLDAGIDMVIVLAGTRTSLWRQTYDRLVDQLRLDQHGVARRLALIPGTTIAHADGSAVGLRWRYAFPGVPRQRMRSQSPTLMVVMKQAQHLGSAARMLADEVYPAAAELDRPFHVLVLDDEADDGSILDVPDDARADDVTGDWQQIPRLIADLWSRRTDPTATRAPNIYATYLAYTATPQANFLQAKHNPLSPREFVIALRTPIDHGEVNPRERTFLEPAGLPSYYTGGQVFYTRQPVSDTLCVPGSPPPEQAAPEAVRAFLVAAAIRRWREPSRMSLQEASENRFESAVAASSSAPRPHTMLIHPSVRTEDHLKTAAQLMEWAGSISAAQATRLIKDGERLLPLPGLLADLTDHEALWTQWVASYSASATAVRDAFDLSATPSVPGLEQWPDLHRILVDDILPHVRIAIINSTEVANDRPEFTPTLQEDGRYRVPRDLLTIFVAGNVMSRGLTLEGLTTTLFLRRSDAPTVDTQMQMQRWFGYRGRHLELCRVFLPLEQLDLFCAYQDLDEALRQEVIGAMNATVSMPPTALVLQGRQFLATGKVASLSTTPLWPGPRPFVTVVNDQGPADPNVELVRSMFAERDSHDVYVAGQLRGRAVDEALDLSQAADLLDRLTYHHYLPGRENWQGRRWRAIEHQAGLLESDPFVPLFRPRKPEPGDMATPVLTVCPYALAAYLRLWKVALTRHIPGLVPTDDSGRSWRLIDLHQRRALQPRFTVGIRYGAGELPPHALAELDFTISPTRRAVVEGHLDNMWGTNDPNAQPGQYRGDDVFDYYARGQEPPPVAVGGRRDVGEPGQILFFVNAYQGSLAVAVGLCIPLGGPDQFAARTPRRSAATS